MTLFAEKVRQVVSKIPSGRVLTYKEVAERAGRPRAWRAVGNILNRNRDYQKIFCHRVIRSDERIGGYNRGTSQKILLLKAEGLIYTEQLRSLTKRRENGELSVLQHASDKTRRVLLYD